MKKKSAEKNNQRSKSIVKSKVPVAVINLKNVINEEKKSLQDISNTFHKKINRQESKTNITVKISPIKNSLQSYRNLAKNVSNHLNKYFDDKRKPQKENIAENSTMEKFKIKMLNSRKSVIKERAKSICQQNLNKTLDTSCTTHFANNNFTKPEPFKLSKSNARIKKPKITVKIRKLRNSPFKATPIPEYFLEILIKMYSFSVPFTVYRSNNNLTQFKEFELATETRVSMRRCESREKIGKSQMNKTLIISNNNSSNLLM